jgi:protein with PEP-CTERM/exosortase system signal
MKNTIAALVVAFALVKVASANPVPITGGIAFGGGAVLFTNINSVAGTADVTALTETNDNSITDPSGTLPDAQVANKKGLEVGTGTFANLGSVTPIDASVVFGTFPMSAETTFPIYKDAGAPISGDVWSFDIGSTVYTLANAGPVEVTVKTNNWILTGNGIFTISGGTYAPTYGVWSIDLTWEGTTADVSDSSFAASDGSTGVLVPVPDGGTTALLVGLGLLGIGMYSRRSRLVRE